MTMVVVMMMLMMVVVLVVMVTVMTVVMEVVGQIQNKIDLREVLWARETEQTPQTLVSLKPLNTKPPLGRLGRFYIVTSKWLW